MHSSAVEKGEARARAVSVSGESLRVDLTDGRSIMVPLAWFPRLLHGTSKERARVELVADGAYIHWPDLDEDLTVAGLLAGRRSNETARSIKAWLDARRPTQVKRLAEPRPSGGRARRTSKGR